MRLLLSMIVALLTTVVSVHPAKADTTVQVVITDNGFQPGVIRAALDEPLTIRVVNRGRHVHEFGIPDYRIYSANLGPGEVSTISFAPWMPGSFDIISDPSGENRPEFVARLIITQK